MPDMKSSQNNSGFLELGVAPSLFEALARLKCTVPTPIQAQAIPIAISGKDVVGIAQTGTGKTFAFGVPMIQRLAQVKGKGLVIVPTRELALQVDESLAKVGRGIGLRTAVLIGGVPIRQQVRALSQDPHIIIATPGRLIDHVEQKTLTLSVMRVVALDEADRMLDMGFAPQITKIFNALPDDRQTMLFSATMPPEIMQMAAVYLKTPTRVEVAPAGTAAERVTQEIFIVRKEMKHELLDAVLKQYAGTTLVFTRTKHGAAKLARTMRMAGYSAAEIHSNRSLGQRREALNGFKSGKYRILVATDIAARGIDVVGIALVVNYDLPMNSEDYVHRIGRTARAGAGGHAVSFVAPDQQKELRGIERLLRQALPVTRHPKFSSDMSAGEAPHAQRRRPFSHQRPRRSYR